MQCSAVQRSAAAAAEEAAAHPAEALLLPTHDGLIAIAPQRVSPLGLFSIQKVALSSSDTSAVAGLAHLTDACHLIVNNPR